MDDDDDDDDDDDVDYENALLFLKTLQRENRKRRRVKV